MLRKIVDLHGVLDLGQGIGRGGLRRLGALPQHVHHIAEVLFQLLAAITDRLQRLLQDVVQELLDLHIAQAAPLIVGLQLVQIGVVRQVFGKVLIIAEGVQIYEHRVALGLAGVADLQVVGVGEHTHDHGADVLRLVGQIDAVAQGFAHLRLAVGAGQTQAGLVVRQQGRGLHQRLAVQLIEAADDLAGLLQHGQLVLAYGHGVAKELLCIFPLYLFH